MKYALIENGVVVQVQPQEATGFIEVRDNVICGQLYDGSNFTNPQPTVKNVDKISKLQAVVYFQNEGVWPSIKAEIENNPDLLDRWSASTVLQIDNSDVVALAQAAEQATGKDIQAMFNEAANNG